MVSLGEIARQAGVRPALEDGNQASRTAGHHKSGSAPTEHQSGDHHVLSVPRILEPVPVAPANVSRTVVNDRTAERSASAVDLYERAIRDGENAQKQQGGGSDRGKVTRSTSTPPEAAVYASVQRAQDTVDTHAFNNSSSMPLPADDRQLYPPLASQYYSHPPFRANNDGIQAMPTPTLLGDVHGRSPSPLEKDPLPQSQNSDHITPEHLRQSFKQDNAEDADPRSPSSVAAGVFSTGSSPVYITPHHHQQPMYAYHTQYYAPQYPYPPPHDGTLGLYAAMSQNQAQHTPQIGGIGSPSQTASTSMQSPASRSGPFSPHAASAAFPGPVYYSSNGVESPFVNDHRGSLSGESSGTGEHHAGPGGHSALLTTGYPAGMHMHQHPSEYVPYGHQQPVYPGHLPYMYPPNAMSPVMQASPTFSSPYSMTHHSPRHSIDLSSSTYRSGPFGVSSSTYQAYMGPHDRYPAHFTSGRQAPRPEQARHDFGLPASEYTQHLRTSTNSTQRPNNVEALPTELARGHLAQAKLREAAGIHDPITRLPLGQSERDRKRNTGEQRLPRPPSHSPWALWVGNVPADANQAELWRFFSTKPPPGIPEPGSIEEQEAILAEGPQTEATQRPDYTTCGVESIHLISRSNCCFVNMASKRHLDHAIVTCNGLSLRPHDARCKPLVCRVRKKDDDTKTGVGAQRGKGFHREWLNEQERIRKAQGLPPLDTSLGDPANTAGTVAPSEPSPGVAWSASHSNSTSSTNSSFLGRHFPKRYFILKSHTEDDLHLSVERGMWATQSHNEPVLDQAFRTSSTVFLIFGANKSGEFFGYATMAGPIVKQESRLSWASRSHGESSGSSGAKSHSSGNIRKLEAAIPEEQEPQMEPPPKIALPDRKAENILDVPIVFSPSGHQVANSPQPISEGPSPAAVQHSKSDGPRGDYLSPHHHDTYPARSPSPFAAAKKGASLDPELLAGMKGLDVNVTSAASDTGVADQLAAGGSDRPGTADEFGVHHKDTALSPEERNARLDQLEQDREVIAAKAADTSLRTAMEVAGGGRPFKVEWTRVQKLAFHRTRHLRNSFNGNREIKISRDGTELEPMVGQQLLELFWRDPTVL